MATERLREPLAARHSLASAVLTLVPPLSTYAEPQDCIGVAEQLAATGDHAGAIDVLEGAMPSPARLPRLALRALVAIASSRLALGDPHGALQSLERGRAIAESDACTDADRAEVFFGLGCCRLTLGSVANAISLLTLALDLCERSLESSDALRTQILDWRSRCYQRRRDWEAARADVELALELAQSLGDDAVTAPVYLQASIVAERERQWLLACFYAEEARTLFAKLGDRATEGRVLNNLGGIHFLLGDSKQAVSYLMEAVEIATERESALDIGYAVSSLAQMRLRSGDATGAESDARRALVLLAGRIDHPNEVGSAELVLAGALLELRRFGEAEEACVRADAVLRSFGSSSHLAAAWITRGDVARAVGDAERAGDLYRMAAEALQDVHF
jgi:tetratricopeptide (TPR) repeat protein